MNSNNTKFRGIDVKNKITNIANKEKNIINLVIKILEKDLKNKRRPSKKFYESVKSVANILKKLSNKNLYKNPFYFYYINSKLKNISILLTQINNTRNESQKTYLSAYVLKDVLMLKNFFDLVKNNLNK